MRTVFLASLAILLAAPATAQQQPPAQRQRPDFAAMHAAMEKRQADDMALLLDLKPAQRPALDAFLASEHPMRGMDGMKGPGHTPPAPGATPPSFSDRLSRMEEMQARHAERQKARLEAVKTFYGSLDPHQKQLFEAMMRLHHGMGGGERMAGHGRAHGGPGGPGGPGPMGGVQGGMQPPPPSGE